MFGNLRQSGSSPAQPDVGPNSGGNQFTPPTNSFLPVAGGSMKGPFGLVHQVCAIVASALNISDPTVNTSYVVINAGGPNLQAISSVSSVDPILILYNGSGGDITLKQAVGPGMNIDTVTQADMVFKNLSHSIFIYNHNPGIWHQITSTTTTGANTALSNLTNPTAINQNLIFGDGTTFSQGKDLINIDTLDFRSTSAFHPYIVGNGSNNQFNIGAHGSDIVVFQNAFNVSTGVPDNGIVEVFGQSHGVHSGTLWVPSLKTVNLSTTIVNGDFVGGMYADALDGTVSHTQKTFGAIFTIADSITNPYAGRLSFQAILPNGSGLNEYMNISNSGIGVNVDIIPSGFTTIQAGNVSFPFKSVYAGALKYLSNEIDLTGTDMTYNIVTAINQKFQINSTNILAVETDNTFSDVGYVDFYQNHKYTNASTGSASALPALPDGYHIIRVNGVRKKFPYYNV